MSFILDHPSQPRRKKKSDRSQYTDQDKHPEEYSVDDHGHVLPVLLHLRERRHNTGKGGLGVQNACHIRPFFLPAVSFHLWLIPLQWLIFPLRNSDLLKCHSFFFMLVSLIKNSRSNFRGPIFFSQTDPFWLERECIVVLEMTPCIKDAVPPTNGVEISHF